MSESVENKEISNEDLEKSILRRDNEEYKIIKKLPKRFPSSANDIYITNKTDFKAQYERCKHLLYSKINKDKNEPNEIFLHAMGPAINRYFLKFSNCSIFISFFKSNKFSA